MLGMGMHIIDSDVHYTRCIQVQASDNCLKEFHCSFLFLYMQIAKIDAIDRLCV